MARSLFVLLVLLIAGVCGQDEDIGGRIGGGTTAAPGAFPYMAFIRETDAGLTFITAGSIISDRWILSGIEVYEYTPSDCEVVVGTNQLDTGGTPYVLESIIIHPNYSAATSNNKLVLSKTATKILYTSTVKCIRRSRSYIGAGVTCTLTGWGTSSTSDETNENDLQQINLNTTTQEYCRSGRSSLSEDQMCTFNTTGRGACGGDYGDPLVHNGELVGVLNVVSTCPGETPSVYSRISSSNDWIDRTTCT